MADKFRNLQDKFLILSNQIEYKLQLFELKSNIEDKNIINDELKLLLKNLKLTVFFLITLDE